MTRAFLRYLWSLGGQECTAIAMPSTARAPSIAKRGCLVRDIRAVFVPQMQQQLRNVYINGQLARLIYILVAAATPRCSPTCSISNLVKTFLDMFKHGRKDPTGPNGAPALRQVEPTCFPRQVLRRHRLQHRQGIG